MNSIRLFWWNERVFHNKSKENYGDLLGKYLVEKISNKHVVFANPQKWSIHDYFSPVYVTIGSILAHVNSKCVVWGSGIVDKNSPVKNANFLAVRGPVTRTFLIEKGYDVPSVYGDPALLLPRFYSPTIEKEYKLGVIPHYVDYQKVKQYFSSNDGVRVIDLMTNSIETTTNEILKAEKIISSSLHGIIVAHAYGIPAVWQKFSGDLYGDDCKFQDYFESQNIIPYKPEIQQGGYSEDMVSHLFEALPILPDYETVITTQDNLLRVCPFKSIT